MADEVRTDAEKLAEVQRAIKAMHASGTYRQQPGLYRRLKEKSEELKKRIAAAN